MRSFASTCHACFCLAARLTAGCSGIGAAGLAVARAGSWRQWPRSPLDAAVSARAQPRVSPGRADSSWRFQRIIANRLFGQQRLQVDFNSSGRLQLGGGHFGGTLIPAIHPDICRWPE